MGKISRRCKWKKCQNSICEHRKRGGCCLLQGVLPESLGFAHIKRKRRKKVEPMIKPEPVQQLLGACIP